MAVKDSERIKVNVLRRFGNDTNKSKIFVSTVIVKGGKSKLETFYVPTNVEVELPVEIIKCLKDRKIPSESGESLKMEAEFNVEKVA